MNGFFTKGDSEWEGIKGNWQGKMMPLGPSDITEPLSLLGLRCKERRGRDKGMQALVEDHCKRGHKHPNITAFQPWAEPRRQAAGEAQQGTPSKPASQDKWNGKVQNRFRVEQRKGPAPITNKQTVWVKILNSQKILQSATLLDHFPETPFPSNPFPVWPTSSERAAWLGCMPWVKCFIPLRPYEVCIHMRIVCSQAMSWFWSSDLHLLLCTKKSSEPGSLPCSRWGTVCLCIVKQLPQFPPEVATFQSGMR